MDIRFDKTEAVILVVGEERHEMLVYANCISTYSRFFLIELQKQWPEGQMRTIALPLEDPKTTTQYLNYVYGETLPTAHLTRETVQLYPDPSTITTVDLANLHILGQRLRDGNMRNAVNEEHIRLSKLGVYPGLDVISIIYEGTTKGNPGRELMVDIHHGRARRGWLDAEAHPVFLLDLAQELLHKAEQAPSPASYRGPACQLVVGDFWSERKVCAAPTA